MSHFYLHFNTRILINPWFLLDQKTIVYYSQNVAYGCKNGETTLVFHMFYSTVGTQDFRPTTLYLNAFNSENIYNIKWSHVLNFLFQWVFVFVGEEGSEKSEEPCAETDWTSRIA